MYLLHQAIYYAIIMHFFLFYFDFFEKKSNFGTHFLSDVNFKNGKYYEEVRQQNCRTERFI